VLLAGELRFGVCYEVKGYGHHVSHCWKWRHW
jgi:hypothetical protein